MVGLVCLKSKLKSAERECRTIYSSGWLGTQSGIRYLIQDSDDDDEELRKETQESSKNQGQAGMDPGRWLWLGNTHHPPPIPTGETYSDAD